MSWIACSLHGCYRMVRYLYIVFDFIQNMQNTVSVQRTVSAKSSAHEVSCYVCGRGLDDGFSVTAKALRNGIAMFCDIHHKMQ